MAEKDDPRSWRHRTAPGGTISGDGEALLAAKTTFRPLPGRQDCLALARHERTIARQRQRPPWRFAFRGSLYGNRSDLAP